MISKRLNKLHTECQKLRDKGHSFANLSKKTLRHLIVNDKQKTMYCYVPKVACTNLKRIFLILTGRMNTTDPQNLTPKMVHSGHYDTRLSSYSSKEISYRLNNYRKVIFVREPLMRLLSAFRNKFANRRSNTSKFHKMYGNKIVQAGRQQQSPLEYGHDVTFSGFVQFLTQPSMNPSAFNNHWAPVSDFCSPCNVLYDFIGKFESIDSDVSLLLKEMSVEDQITSFPARNNRYQRTEETFEQYYRTVDTKHLIALLKIYELDYNLFGYPIPTNSSLFTTHTV